MPLRAHPAPRRVWTNGSVLAVLLVAGGICAFGTAPFWLLDWSFPGQPWKQGDAVFVGSIPGRPTVSDHVASLLDRAGIPAVMEGSLAYGIEVRRGDRFRAAAVLRRDVRENGTPITLDSISPRSAF